MSWAYRGLPQGSVLSPILYAIYVMDMESIIDPNCKIIQYADDVVIYSVSLSLREAIGSVRTSLLRIDAILKLSGLTLAPSKTSFVIFETKGNMGRNDRGHRERRIGFNDATIRECKRVRFLG